jgi:hypothetical protein
MADFVSKAEEFWKHSKVLAWILVLTAMGAVLFATYWSPSPGVSIGLLACAAGIMSVRPEMHFYEKLAWILVLISFTILEVRAIVKSDQENFANLINQNSKFKETNDSLFWLYILSQSQFTDTMKQFSQTNKKESGHFESLLKQDQVLFEHERQLAESLNGTLVPGNEPTPKNSCGPVPHGSVILVLGNEAQHNASIVGSFPHTVLAWRHMSTAPIVSLDRSPTGNIAVMLDLRSADGRIIARMNKDGFVVNRNNYLEMKRDKSSLKIIDEFGSEVLNVQYLNSEAIAVSGQNIGLPSGVSGICIAGLPNVPDFAIDPIRQQ